jgi:hypothetical protein
MERAIFKGGRMKIEQQVPEPELCKRLKELGYPQEGLFWWHNWKWVNEGQPKTTTTGGWTIKGKGFPPFFPAERDCVAPTVAELGEWFTGQYEYDCKLHQTRHGWNSEFAILCTKLPDNKFEWVYGETEANARAKMLIWLVENGYVDLNQKEEE